MSEESNNKTAAQGGGESSATGAPARRNLRMPLIAGVLIVIAATGGFLYWLHARNYASTDDAFIDGNSVQISPRVSGTVVAVNVMDNQYVHKGDVLFKIDPSDYQAQVQSAQANMDAALAREQAAKSDLSLTQVTSGAGVEQAQSALQAARSSVSQAQAEVEAAHAEVVRANDDLKRYRTLYKKDEASRQHLQQVVATARTAQARWQAAQRRVATAKAQVREARAKLKNAQSAPQRVAVKRFQLKTAQAAVEQARAALRTARLNLSYTVIRAPHSGHITKKSVLVGDTVQEGQVLTALVYGEPWVTANFKETDLTRMRQGQPVDVHVDAYPSKTFKAHVQSIQRGTGAHFSLLPPENATGNYVKVVQRVPVKIVFNQPPGKSYVLALGMSAEPTVDLTAHPVHGGQSGQ